MINFIKIVQNDRPNDPGRWMKLPRSVETDHLAGLVQKLEAIAEFVPEGYHAVQMSTDNPDALQRIFP